MSRKPFVFQIAGYSDSGKTTLLTRLIPMLEGSGIRVGVIKHDGAHDFELDQPGKDTHRFAEAGASLIAIQSRSKTAIIQPSPLPLGELIDRLAAAGAELILVEGFKREAYPKLVMLREGEQEGLVQELTHIEAIAAWYPYQHADIPVFSVDDADGIFVFLKNRFSRES